jgi:ribosomal protein S27AE
MMQFENPDPRGEYIRTCPYCDEVFTAQHMNRKYCPEQNGKIDYCKNRYKRLAKLEKLEQSIIEEDLKLDTTISSEEDELELIDARDVKQQICNIGIMAATLGNRQTIKLPKYYLKDKGAVYEAYDKQYQLPGSDLQVLTYGPYAIAWGCENHIILTHKTLIPWIQ